MTTERTQQFREAAEDAGEQTEQVLQRGWEDMKCWPTAERSGVMAAGARPKPDGSGFKKTREMDRDLETINTDRYCQKTQTKKHISSFGILPPG